MSVWNDRDLYVAPVRVEQVVYLLVLFEGVVEEPVLGVEDGLEVVGGVPSSVYLIVDCLEFGVGYDVVVVKPGEVEKNRQIYVVLFRELVDYGILLLLCRQVGVLLLGIEELVLELRIALPGFSYWISVLVCNRFPVPGDCRVKEAAWDLEHRPLILNAEGCSIGELLADHLKRILLSMHVVSYLSYE